MLFRFLFISFTLNTLTLYSSTETNNHTQNVENIVFTPPKDWRFADEATLPKHVKLMIVGKGAHEFPPSISVASETYSGTLKQYLKIVKELNASKGNEWKDLGIVRTDAGSASLTQTDYKSQWGDVRMMHVMLKKNGVIYILTAAALKSEFPKFYKEIFASMRSMHFSTSSQPEVVENQ